MQDLKWYDPNAEDPPWIEALAEVRHLAPREGWCYQHVQAIIVAIDQYAEAALGNRDFFSTRQHWQSEERQRSVGLYMCEAARTLVAHMRSQSGPTMPIARLTRWALLGAFERICRFSFELALKPAMPAVLETNLGPGNLGRSFHEISMISIA